MMEILGNFLQTGSNPNIFLACLYETTDSILARLDLGTLLNENHCSQSDTFRGPHGLTQ